MYFLSLPRSSKPKEEREEKKGGSRSQWHHSPTFSSYSHSISPSVFVYHPKPNFPSSTTNAPAQKPYPSSKRPSWTSKSLTPPQPLPLSVSLFHDCFVRGCDASVLISRNHFNNKPEREADINVSLPGDAIFRFKTALELTCPGVVSCSDILAIATRDLIAMVRGPFYKVPLGRKDSLISQSTHVNLPTTPLSHTIALFSSKGFSIREMVALSGAHTIGFSHCREFANRIYNFSGNQSHDPALNPRCAQGL